VEPALILTIGISIGYGISFLHRRDYKIPIIAKLILKSEREKDKEFPGKGALRFFVGTLLVLLIFRNSPDIVVGAVTVLALGDSASTLVGVSVGKHRLSYNKEKSLEGSLGGFSAAFIGLSLLTSFGFQINLVAALVGSLVESLPLGIDDNLTVPISTGLVIWAFTGAIII
jgi:dolichol kinase